MHELIANIHMHTKYSDGHGSHEEIAQAAIHAGLDVVIVTDHNVWVKGPEGYYKNGPQRVLLLVGEEVHDTNHLPQKNHLLVFGANKEMSTLAANPQHLLNSIQEVGGLAFLAHPFEKDSPAIGEPAISWVDWEVQGYTGIELWNAMSELKSLIRSKLHALFFGLNPHLVGHGPPKQTIRKWDELHAEGRQVVAFGGSDAHAFPHKIGPLRRVIFPYEFHFRAVNTHLFIPEPLNDDVDHDRALVLHALRNGHAFVGYDLPAPTRGFRYSATGKNTHAWMGDEISAKDGVTLQIRLPRRTECQLIKDGQVVKVWYDRETCTYITNKPGVYRVEAYINYYRRRRGWIFSNPIYVR